MPNGFLPTGIVPTTRWRAVSRTDSVSSLLLTTYAVRPSRVSAIAVGKLPTAALAISVCRGADESPATGGSVTELDVVQSAGKATAGPVSVGASEANAPSSVRTRGKCTFIKAELKISRNRKRPVCVTKRQVHPNVRHPAPSRCAECLRGAWQSLRNAANENVTKTTVPPAERCVVHAELGRLWA